MRKALKFVEFLIFVFLLFVAVTSIAFYHLIRVGEFRRFLISEIEQETQLKVQLGEADLELGRNLGIGFHDVEIWEPDGAQPVLTAQRITARVALLPLFKRKLIFYEIRLQKPTARVVRDKDGHIPILKRLLSLPFFKDTGSQFALDLRTVRIADGAVDFNDHFNEQAPVDTRLRGVDLVLQRVTGDPLRDFFQKLARPKMGRMHGPALKFDLQTGIERDGQHATVQARGTMMFPEEQFQLDKVWWSAETRVTDLPAPMIRAFASERFPVKSLGGKLNSQLEVEGNLNERLQVKGAVAFTDLMADAPEIFSTPLTPGNGRLELDMTWQPERWDFTRVNLRSAELKTELKGVLSESTPKDPHIQLSLISPFLPINVFKKYLPTKWIDSRALEAFLKAVHQGDLRVLQAGVDAKFSEIRGMAETGYDKRVWFDAELRDVSANFPGGYLPLNDFQGRIALEKGVLSFSGLRGYYGTSRLSNIDGSYRFAAAGQEIFQARARGEINLAELRGQLNQGFVPARITKVASAIHEMGGTGRFDIAVNRTAEAVPQVEGKITLDGARLQADNYSLSEIRGDIAVTNSEIKAERVRALLSGSPVQVQLGLKDYGDEDGTFDLRVDSTGIRAGVVTKLLLSTGSPQDPGMIRGFVRYQGSFAKKEGRKFTGTLDLSNVQLATQPLLQPLKQLNGRIKIDDRGVEFQNIRGMLVGYPANFSGRWRYSQKPQLMFDFAAPNLDVSYLLSEVDTESSEFYASLQAQGRIVLAKGSFKNLEFTDFKSDVAIDRRVWRLSNSTLKSASGLVQGVATIADKPDTLGLNVTPKVQGVPVPTFLKWFGISNSEITGKVNVTGSMETIGQDGAERKRNLNGSFQLRIEDGTLHHLRILVQILNLLDLSRWFTFKLPDLTKQGIRFRSITGDFKVTQGVYSTENLLIDSDDLRMTGAGKIDVPKDAIDFVVVVRPFAGIDTVINYIPLIGRGIAAIKNSFLVASFNITGSIDNPTITPAPLNTLSEVLLGVLGIPKNMIGISGEEKKQEPQKDQPREPTQERVPAPAP